MKKEYLSFLKLICTISLFSVVFCLAGCQNKPEVHPVEVVSSSEGKEEATDTEEKNDEVEEPIAEEETDVTEQGEEDSEDEDTEEFTLLEPDEPESTSDDNGNVITQDGKPVVDVVFFMGQSNMSGAGGSTEGVPEVLDGHGYEFRAISDPTKLYKIEEPFGKNESFIGGICDLPGAKKGSLVSCFANEYYRETGVPIVGVSASQGATTTDIWLSVGFQVDLKQRYDRTITWLEDNGYYIRNKYAVWFQGESDAANHVNPDIYTTNMDNIIRPMFISGLTKVFIVTPGRTLSIKNYFDGIVEQQLKMCKESGYYALGTNILSKTSAAYMVDEWHYNQQVLNLIGIETAKSVAYYSLNKAERLDYNYKEDCTFIPDGFDYPEDSSVEPLDLSDINKLLDDYWEDYINEDTAN